ncbi:hypothetical protein DPMN_089556 [Dreissena polymorpha]|uniref:Mutator-like transposase domain-containing protein n=1 Tax=Dreissena polymorpha TaxID=45954 RepID=A0A9D4KW64_DREPO|nr:hypothetical protein DPMN_089556 [Dreissena polymorpha]
MKVRNKSERFAKSKKKQIPIENVDFDNNYSLTELFDSDMCENYSRKSYSHLLNGVKRLSRSVWGDRRRLIDSLSWKVLLNKLQYGQFCNLCPIPLTIYNIVGELQNGLSGYLYVVCENPDCRKVNRVAYGKQHHLNIRGMPCFDVNTKLGTALKVSLGRPVKVNNFLTTLNITLIANRNLKKMEAWAGFFASSTKAANYAYEKEMDSRPDITQIATVHLKTGFKFSTYVKTTVPISSEAQKVIGICVDDHGIMRVNGGSVDSVSIKTTIS